MEVTEVSYGEHPASIEVSFELSCDDWCLIRQSTHWKRILAFVEESEKRGSRMTLKEKTDLLESS